jgi:hypothetical protein
VRSFGEIWFRLRQETANAAALVRPPDLPAGTDEPAPTAILPDPESFLPRIRGSDYAQDLERIAGMICAHRFPLLGDVAETGPDTRWRRDMVRGIESGLGYFRTIPYLNTERAGDHKLIWELNRHQHLALLAKAFRLTGRRDFLDEIPRQLESWQAQNPWLRGLNWASALEVAMRAISWIWVDHLAGAALEGVARRGLWNELYRHGVYLEHNLSVYFAPNTHLLGEAVALHALGAIYAEWPRSARWRELGRRIVGAQMEKQVREDGSHFEQSSYYHVYALDLFLLYAVTDSGTSERFREKLRRMADYLTALTSGDGAIPLLGDDDGGNLFHPYGDRRRFGLATLASCCAYFETNAWPCDANAIAVQAAWWLGGRAFAPRHKDTLPGEGPRLFTDAGVAVFSRMPIQVVSDTRGFGHGGAGHSHAHALSVVCRKGDRDILIDPGTFTYTAEPVWRARFRGTGFHNTVRVDARDQADDGGPFRWLNKPETTIRNWTTEKEFTYLRAVCGYRGIEHERQLVWIPERELLVIVDSVRGSAEDAQPHLIEQFWHCGGAVALLSPGVWRVNEAAILSIPPSDNVREFSADEYGWQSDAPGQKGPSPVIIVERTARLPVTLAAVVAFEPAGARAPGLEVSEDQIRLVLDDARSITFSDDLPTIEM